MPTVLRGIGYEVVVIGKVAHNTWAKFYDFDAVIGPPVGISDTAEVAKFLSERKSTKPLCLFVGTRHPHVPWSEESTYDSAKVTIPPMHVDTAVTREERAKYLTDITKSDTLLGEVRALAREKVTGDTLFIYTADHGGQWPFAKWNLYDAGIRIPLIIAWPGTVKPATTSDAMVCWPDLLPTFIELGGGKVPDGIDGKSFAGILRGATTTHRDRVFTTHSGDGDFNVYPIRVRPHPRLEIHPQSAPRVPAPLAHLTLHRPQRTRVLENLARRCGKGSRSRSHRAAFLHTPSRRTLRPHQRPQRTPQPRRRSKER